MALNQGTLRKLISLATLLVLFVVFAGTSSHFISLRNLFSILRDASIIGIISVGLTLVIVTAGIDLSTGAALAFCCMVMANFYRYTETPVWCILIIGIITGGLCGLLNGLVITRLKLPEFIATLATMGIFRGLTYMTAIKVNGTIINQPIRDFRFTMLAGDAGGLYYVTIVFFLVIIAGQLLLRNTRFGAFVYATGTNMKSAELSGVNTNNVRLAAFVITGFCCGIGALFMVGRMQTATTDFGVGMEFDIIAAVVVGGCALNGGRGDMIGSMIGAVFMAMLDNGIYKYQINTSWQPIIKGAIIVLVIVFDAWYRNLMEKRLQIQKNADISMAGGKA